MAAEPAPGFSVKALSFDVESFVAVAIRHLPAGTIR
jgi:hypothetical protein